MKQVIGFATQYYTLWNVSEPTKRELSAHDYTFVTTYTYRQNLSKSLDKAKEKLKGTDYEIDLSLRGTSSFETSSGRFSNLEDYHFSFGKLIAEDIRTSNDVWQLDRAMREEKSMRTRVYARRRLIELDELVRQDWIDREWIGDELIDVKRRYMTKEQYQKIMEKQLSDSQNNHYYKDGEKVTLKVKLLKHFSYETQYGMVYINVFLDEQSRQFKYKGSTPPYIENKNELIELSGTVKHSEYNGVKETRLMRIKVKTTKTETI